MISCMPSRLFRVNFLDAYTAPVSMEIKPLNGNRFLLNQLKIGTKKSDNEGQEFLFGDTIISAAGRFIVEDIPDKYRPIIMYRSKYLV